MRFFIKNGISGISQEVGKPVSCSLHTVTVLGGRAAVSVLQGGAFGGLAPHARTSLPRRTLSDSRGPGGEECVRTV